MCACYTNNYGRCHDQDTCESGGSCNDWTYESWMPYKETYGSDPNAMADSDTVSCRVPFKTGEFCMPSQSYVACVHSFLCLPRPDAVVCLRRA